MYEDPVKKKIIADTIIRDCKRSNSTAFTMIIFCVFAFIIGIYMTVTGYRGSRITSFLLIAVSPIGLYMFITSLLSMKRYCVKAAQGRFTFRHATVTDRKMTNTFISSKFEVFLKSDDDEYGNIESVEVERTLYEKMAVGLSGWYAVIEDERKGLLVSPYWFIPDNETGASVAPLTPAPVLTGSAPSTETAEDLTKAFRNANAGSIGASVLAALSFFIGSVLLLSAIITENGRSFALLGVMTCLIGVWIVTFRCVIDVFKKRKYIFAVWAIWLQFAMFGLFFIAFDRLPDPGRLAILAVYLFMNLGMTAFANLELIKTYRRLSEGACSVTPATVVSLNAKQRASCLSYYPCTAV